MWKLDSDCTDAIALCSAARPFTSPNIFLFFSPSCPCPIDQVKLTDASELEDIDFALIVKSYHLATEEELQAKTQHLF